MKVLEFAFDAGENSDYLPHKYGTNCVVYTGTHDNDTAEGWFASLDEHDRNFVREYIGSRIHTGGRDSLGFSQGCTGKRG